MTFDEDDHSDGNVDVEEADYDDNDGDLEKSQNPGSRPCYTGTPHPLQYSTVQYSQCNMYSKVQ